MVKNLTDEDGVRVKSFENGFAQVDESEDQDACGKWLKLVFRLDGIHPPIEREVLVNPDLTMRCLHEQVLCPTMGWKPNYHCYAFRRRPSITLEQLGSLEGTLQAIVWIGPKV